MDISDIGFTVEQRIRMHIFECISKVTPCKDPRDFIRSIDNIYDYIKDRSRPISSTGYQHEYRGDELWFDGKKIE